jgi:predicted phosphodiesterase
VERIALMSDIHGNLPALEAVLADIERRGLRRIICLGDLAGKGPDGARVVDLCQDRCEVVIRGNWDEGLSGVSDHSVLQWHREQLGPERQAYLGSLPLSVDFALGETRVRLVHASPQGVYRRVHQDASWADLDSMFDNTDLTGYGGEPDMVGYGDIHAAYVRCFRQRILFNVGSVGNPLDLPLACYALLEGNGGPGAVAISLVRVPYDIERAIQDAVNAGMPDLEAYAGELRTARYRHAPAPVS